MAQVYKKINIDVNSKITDIVTAVQGDASSRYLDVVLWDSSVAIDLTGHEVRIYGKKADGTEFYNNGEITNATGGRCQFELTSQALALAQDLEVQIIIFKNNVEILSTQPFTIHVVKSLLSDSSIESSNEYGALVVLYQNLYEAYDLMTEMVQKIGNAGTVAQGLSLSTMFEVWEWLITYLQENSTAGVVDVVNVVNGKIGTPVDITSNLFNEVDKLKQQVFDSRIPLDTKLINTWKNYNTLSASISPETITEAEIFSVTGSGWVKSFSVRPYNFYVADTSTDSPCLLKINIYIDDVLYGNWLVTSVTANYTSATWSFVFDGDTEDAAIYADFGGQLQKHKVNQTSVTHSSKRILWFNKNVKVIACFTSGGATCASNISLKYGVGDSV